MPDLWQRRFYINKLLVCRAMTKCTHNHLHTPSWQGLDDGTVTRTVLYVLLLASSDHNMMMALGPIGYMNTQQFGVAYILVNEGLPSYLDFHGQNFDWYMGYSQPHGSTRTTVR